MQFPWPEQGLEAPPGHSWSHPAPQNPTGHTMQRSSVSSHAEPQVPIVQLRHTPASHLPALLQMAPVVGCRGQGIMHVAPDQPTARAVQAKPVQCPALSLSAQRHCTPNLQAIHWAGEGAVRPVVACAADALRRLQAGGPHTGSVAGADGVPKARASLCTGWPHPPLGADIAARAVPVADSGVRVAGADPYGAL